MELDAALAVRLRDADASFRLVRRALHDLFVLKWL